MHQFNNQLEVGQLAMIINTKQPENRSLIGKIVTVECFTEVGEDISQYFDIDKGRPVRESQAGMVMVSGVVAPKAGVTNHGQLMLDGYCRFKKEYLMPLPPLEEKEVKREMELTQ